MSRKKIDYHEIQLHAGRWHTDTTGNYWSGDWRHRTAVELLTECKSTIRDLLRNHPELNTRGKRN